MDRCENMKKVTVLKDCDGMSMQFKGSMEECFDTRYEQVSADNFKEYAEEFLKNYLADGLKAEPIE